MEAVGSTTEPMKLSTEIAQILMSHSRLNQALLVQAWIFITRCTNFFLVQSNDENNHQDQSLFKHTWRVEEFAFHWTVRNSPRAVSSENHALRCHNEPNSIVKKKKLRPVTWSTERKPDINSLKEDENNGEVVSARALSKLQEVQVVRVLRDSLFERSEDRSKAIAWKKPLEGQPFRYSSGHKEVSSFCTRKVHVCDAVPLLKTSQESTWKAKQSSVHKHREYPGVIVTGICSGKVNQ